MQELTETRGAPRYTALADKHRSSVCDRGPVGLERGVGKHAFESQCNASNPCSRMSEMLLPAVHFNVDVSIRSMKDAACWEECFIATLEFEKWPSLRMRARIFLDYSHHY